jgi:Domain of unknown function (DUF1707)
MAKTDDPDIRISNAERDEAVATLGEHLSTGRLELTEYEDRCTRAVAARTRGDLESLFADLPAPHPDLSSATPPAPPIPQPGPPARRDPTPRPPAAKAAEVVAGLALILGVPTAILLTVFAGLWWVFIPVVAVVLITGAIADTLKSTPNRPPPRSRK